MKRVLTIQDISCIGKCSLTVALPILSAMGLEAAILPTAVLSTHTVFENFTCKDLTDQIVPITAHWKQQNLQFSALYSGFLASYNQIDLVKQLFQSFKTEHNFVFVDPAMADNGALYPGFDLEFAHHMGSLCSAADVIVPNLTEACMMTDTPYSAVHTKAFILDLMKRLQNLGSKLCIITGISLEEGKTGVLGCDCRTGEMFYYEQNHLPGMFYGTGDIFASTCVGALSIGKDWKEAIQLAADFTYRSIEYTLRDPNANWYGVNFEEALPHLIGQIQR